MGHPGSGDGEQATSSLQVVFLSVGVPVEIGLVASLRHPGGNMTGVTFDWQQSLARRLQLLQEVMPTLYHVALLYAVGNPNVAHAIQAVEKAAPVLGLAVQLFGVRDVDELDPLRLPPSRGAGRKESWWSAGALTYTHRQKIAEPRTPLPSPVCSCLSRDRRDGGLLSLGPNMAEIARKGAGYVGEAVKGGESW